METLDRYNEQGVPVKGIWEFDNMFSLQEILPRYAPDIIENIKRRVRENGDEVILMSYNNGLVSAMTEEEANDAVLWAVCLYGAERKGERTGLRSGGGACPGPARPRGCRLGCFMRALSSLKIFIYLKADNVELTAAPKGLKRRLRFSRSRSKIC